MAQKVRHLSNCSVSTSLNENVAVIEASYDVSTKKKEEARKVLYLKRI